MSDLYAPDTDRLNVDGLNALGGTLDLTINRVEEFEEKNAKGRLEKKLKLHVSEYALPYIPCKTMGRALIGVWGPPNGSWPGKRLRVYVDPSVTMGPTTTGGVRVSHVSGIESEQIVMITPRRGQRAPWTLKPLPQEQTLEDVLEAVGLTAEQLDAWGAANGQPLVATLDAHGRKAAAQWLAGGGAATVAEFSQGGKE